jgi:hypothetical protein
MFDRFHKKTLFATAAGLLSALGVGGIAVAQSTGTTTAPAKAPAAAPTQAETPDAGGTADAPDANDPADKADAPGAAETPDANDPADKADSGSEKPDPGETPDTAGKN